MVKGFGAFSLWKLRIQLDRIIVLILHRISNDCTTFDKSHFVCQNKMTIFTQTNVYRVQARSVLKHKIILILSEKNSF